MAMASSVPNNIIIGQGSIVSNDSVLKGTITIGQATIIQSRAKLLGEEGPIVIGDNNIIQEQCVIKHSVHNNGQDRPRTMMIGSNNIFEFGCVIMAISIGNNNIFKAKCFVGPEIESPKLLGEEGPIVIGNNNIIQEQCVIKHSVDINGQDRPRTMMIGSNNIFEVGCVIMAISIGNNNIFKAKCFVGPEIEVGNNSIIGAGVALKLKEKFPDNAIITGSNYSRTIAADRHHLLNISN